MKTYTDINELKKDLNELIVKKPQEKAMCKRCRRYFFECNDKYEGEFSMITNKEENPLSLCSRCLDIEIHKEDEKKDGIWLCPSCNRRTDEKTYNTRCVICKGELKRMGSF